MIDTIFAPLTTKEKEWAAQKKPNKKSSRVALTPVPEGSPDPSFQHHEYGTPDEIYTYRDTDKRVVGYTCRFELENGTKKVLPYTYCRDTKTGRMAWQWKAWNGNNRHAYGLEQFTLKPHARRVLIVEGEKCADAANRALSDYVCLTSSGGSNAADKTHWGWAMGQSDIYIWPDNDDQGRAYAQKVFECVKKASGRNVVILDSSAENKPEKWDIADAIDEGWSEEELTSFIEANSTKRLRVMDINHFIALDIPERKQICFPVIAEQGLAMLFAKRGFGKTHISLEIALSVATGCDCLGGKWKVPEARKVLYVDGEMPARSMQERLQRAIEIKGVTPQNGYLRLITPDFQEMGIPDLATTEGQDAISEQLDGVDLVILDNLSCLCRSGKENDAESWVPIQEWVLRLRSKGIAVLFIHHAGKSDQQRGTSKREDVLDTILTLKRPEDYRSSQGARFIISYEKSREVFGDYVNEFEAWLKENGEWEVSLIEQPDYTHVIELHKEGKSLREIEGITGISKTRVGNIINDAKNDGTYNE